MSIFFRNADWLGTGGVSLLRTAHKKARHALQKEAGLSEADLDSLTDIMAHSLLSLYQAGQADETKLSNYAVATTLRHLCAGQR